MSLESFILSLESLPDALPTLLADELGEHKEAILDAQKEQLFEGKNSDGEDIRPYYSEDTFFHSKSAAERYAQWKASLSYPSRKSGSRNADAPNLFINGRLVHDNLEVEFNGNTITIDTRNTEAKRVIEKYGLSTFGLSQDNWDELIRDEQEGILDGLRERVLNHILSE